jgi:hypothetical protein
MVFGSNVFRRVLQQDKGKRLGFSAVWRSPPQKGIMDPEPVLRLGTAALRASPEAAS